MSNYRRLISYIYAYEGGVKGKNIGFAKLETRNGQCRIQVSVRKVFLGSQDMGVFLLSAGSEIFLGRIFVRNGAGEFRTSVAVDHVAGSEHNIEQCYGLTIHNMDDSWQNYTTIWEDAVAHAAEVELAEAVSELAEVQEVSQASEAALSEKKAGSIIENIDAEIQAQDQQTKEEVSAQDTGEEIPTTFVQPRKEEPQKILWPREEGQQAAGKTPDNEQAPGEKQPQLQQRFEEQHQEVQPEGQSQWSPQGQLEKELNEEVLETPKANAESQRMQENEARRQVGEQGQEQPQGQSQEQSQEQSREKSQLQEQPRIPRGEGAGSQGEIQVQPSPAQRVQPQQRRTSQVQFRQQRFQGSFSRRPVHGMPQQEQYYQEMPFQQPAPAPSYSMEAAKMMQPVMQQPAQPIQQPRQLMQAQPTQVLQEPFQTQTQSQQPMQPQSQQSMQPMTQPAQLMQQPIQSQPVQPQLQQPVMPPQSQQPIQPQDQQSIQLQGQQPVQQPMQSQGQQPVQQPMQPQGQQSMQPQLQQPAMPPTDWQQQPENPEQEEAKEGVDMETLWQHFCRTYPKIQAFDYDGNSEILTIKPQDIGLLPREIWTYGNNSFLLHGYYNHRYLILARLSVPNGGARFLLGVPGHYYSNEKYMASMFGFPNFVMSKNQPPNDNRFGYWYTDLRLGF